MELIKYAGWDHCYRLSNGIVDLVVTGDVGPRIIRFGFVNEDNMFKEYSEQAGKTAASEWLIFGGHRLWHAPEAQPRTYFPDVEPVLVQEIDNGLLVTQKPEPTTGLQKQLEISMAKDKAEVTIKHVLINHNLWAVETAPWAVTVLDTGGVAILPLPPRGPHPEFILPTSQLSLWPYTKMNDPRWHFGEQFVLLHQNPEIATPQKIGLFAPDGWAAYANKGNLFVKHVPIHFDGPYPDLGVNIETFTNDVMLELESLGPVESIPPRGQIDHLEHWTLVKDVEPPQNDADVFKNVLPNLK